ncbi:MAG TPA: hypothetical protein VMX13_10045 [Sedimentisphaerales bacterium]|nr:hypothetical protein [Sedimentisphaerales bacterium]
MNKRVFCAALFVFGLCQTRAVALEGMAAPRAALDKGQFSVGLDYSFSKEDVKVSGSYVSYLFGEKTLAVKDAESKRYYLSVGYGVRDWLEGYVRIGLANADYDSDELEFNGDDKMAWGYGMKATFWQWKNLTVGGLAQMSWINTDGQGLGPDWEGEYDAYEAQIAAGVTVDMGDWSIYGGPFYYMLEGDFDFDLNSPQYPRLSADVKEESAVGGFVGAEFVFGEGLSFGLDYAMTGDGFAIGAGFILAF